MSEVKRARDGVCCDESEQKGLRKGDTLANEIVSNRIIIIEL